MALGADAGTALGGGADGSCWRRRCDGILLVGLLHCCSDAEGGKGDRVGGQRRQVGDVHDVKDKALGAVGHRLCLLLLLLLLLRLLLLRKRYTCVYRHLLLQRS